MSCKFCDREATHKGAGLCNRCYSWVNYWRKQSVTKFMRRMEVIDFWADRGAKAGSLFGAGKVRYLSKRKKARRA